MVSQASNLEPTETKDEDESHGGTEEESLILDEDLALSDPALLDIPRDNNAITVTKENILKWDRYDPR